MKHFIDLSHSIENGMITYAGLPGPVITDYLSRAESRGKYAPGIEFQIGKIEMVANTGTYLDTPYHRYEDGADLSQLELASVADVPAVVVRLEQRSGAIAVADLQPYQVQNKAVLLQTGWDQHWRTEDYSNGKHPFLTSDVAELLISCGVKLVGIDSYNIDDTSGGDRPVHSSLLKAGIPIVEHLCRLEQLPDEGIRFFAVPVKIRGFGSFPTRAFAIIVDD